MIFSPGIIIIFWCIRPILTGSGLRRRWRNVSGNNARQARKMSARIFFNPRPQPDGVSGRKLELGGPGYGTWTRLQLLAHSGRKIQIRPAMPRNSGWWSRKRPLSALMILMDLGEGLVRHVVRHVLDRCQEDIGLLTSLWTRGLQRVWKNMLAALAPHSVRRGRAYSWRRFWQGIHLSRKGFTASGSPDRARAFPSRKNIFSGRVIVYDYPREIKVLHARR